MEEWESLWTAQSLELDLQKRKQMVRELERWVLDERVSFWTILGWTHIYPAWRVEVKGMRGYDLYSFTKPAMWERVWLGD